MPEGNEARTGRSDGKRGVSRRRFVQTVGVTGVGAGVAGCLGGDGDGDQGDVGTVNEDEDITLQWAASEQEAGEADALVQALHDAGMPENIDIEFLSGGDVTEDRRNQYSQWLQQGRSQPDLLRMDNGWTIPFIVREQLLDLSEAFDQEDVDRINEDYFEMSLETAKPPEGDSIYAVPLWMGLPTMQYRKDLVEDAGYDPEGENWATESMTWERFSQVTADVHQQSGVEYGYTFQADTYEGLSCCNFNEFMTSWGGAYFGGTENLFGPVGDRPITINEEPVLQSIRMIRAFIHGSGDSEALDGYEQVAPRAVLQWTEDPSQRPFVNGNAVMHRNWPFSIGQLGAEDAMGEDLGVMPIPYAVSEDEAEYEGTGGPVAALGGWHLAVNPNSENLAAAVEAARAASTDEFNLSVFEILGQIPPKPDLLETDRAREVPVMGRYLDALQVAGENAIPRPVTVVWPDESTQVAQEVNAAYNQDKPPEQAMSDLESTLEEIEQSA